MPKDAKIILKRYVVRELPGPFISETLKIAKEIANSGALTSEEYLSKLQGHAELLRSLGHHCDVELTDYAGMTQVREQQTNAANFITVSLLFRHVLASWYLEDRDRECESRL